ncbi:MAG: hypothetical protein Q8Q94_00405 [bacterium]|nr:hypothetical protein [bacterium]MDZ4299947.1 hypothetical protein [Candidatus Sungbacteria bacterium]
MVFLIRDYLRWHYTAAVRELLGILGNLLWFFAHLFSLRLLLATLFSPFYRIHEDYFSVADIEKTLASIAANLVSRVVGFLLRIIVIALGIITEGVLIVLILPILLVWIFLPAIIIGSLGLGIFGLLHNL